MTRASPARDAAAQSLQFAFVSCQNYEQGLYTAFDYLAEERLDLLAHLGDYIYEGAGADGRVRKHDGGEINTLADYRRRYAQYKSDVSLQWADLAVHRSVSWGALAR